MTYIAMIIDRSGSISSCLEQMQTAVNDFISAQRELEGECHLKLVQFDNKYDVVYDGPVADAPNYRIEPRDSTALHDAVGRTINAVGKELEALEEAERPDKVMFVIITDGYENASHEFDASTVRKMVEHQTEKYNWNFDYLGANQDAVLVGESLGVLTSNAMSFATSKIGLSSLTRSLSDKTTTYRMTNNYVSYSADDRSKAMLPDDENSIPIVEQTKKAKTTTK